MDESMIFCPLVDRNIDSIDCVENQSICEKSIPAEYKQKPDWKQICANCKYQEDVTTE